MFDMQNEISNIWNASIESFENRVYIIKNATGNQDILVGAFYSLLQTSYFFIKYEL